MPKQTFARATSGPTILAIDPWLQGNPRRGRSHPLLSDEERERLASIATLVRFKKGDQIYSLGETADALFTLEAGVVKTHRPRADGRSHITAFLFHGDLLGVAEEGTYTDSATAVTSATLYRLPVRPFRRQFSNNALVEFHFVSKLVHDLRLAQRQAFIMGTHSAERKVAMFLQLLEQMQFARHEDAFEIFLPMPRVDIADYLGLSPSALSRAFHQLEYDHAIKMRDVRHVVISDRDLFDRLAEDRPSSAF